ncbi:MAG: hypothetical protein M4579_003449 [Chaenotheca gracillima]|nr:MAG: hypothetical protein M4579_003449 [Chaenotheca gracillima]
MGESQNGSRSWPRVAFGRDMRKQFLFDPAYLNLNHGSFGTYPRPIRDTLRSYQDKAESRPDRFIRYEYPKQLDKSREALAKILHAPVEELVLMPNATTGINTVLRGLVYKPGDHILYFNTTYGACGKTVEYIAETTQAKSVRLDLEYPLEDDEVIQRTRDAIREVKQAGGQVRVALLDTIISMPGLRVPFERLVELCREEGVLSLVDGAHGAGHIELDLAKLDADFFVSNCHKWLFVPRGSAVFHVPLRNQSLVRSSLPTSHGWHPAPGTTNARKIFSAIPQVPGKSDFINEFEFIGTLDNSPYLCIPEAIAFREQACGGEAAIREYCFDLAKKGGKLVAEALGTEVLDNKTETLTRCCLVNVRLPFVAMTPSTPTPEVGMLGGKLPIAGIDIKYADTVVGWMQRAMADDGSTFIAIFFHNGSWYARLSAQVYLTIDDFGFGARVLEDVCEKVRFGAFLERAERAGKGELDPEQDPS